MGFKIVFGVAPTMASAGHVEVLEILRVPVLQVGPFGDYVSDLKNNPI